MSSFASLKSRKKNNLELFQKQIEATKNGGFKKDERLWTLGVDASGNGTATIRFLPAPNGEGAPFARLYKFSFKKAGKWYIENSPNTLGLPDPVAEYNKELWDQAEAEGPEESAQFKHPLKNDVRTRGRKERYLVNILVTADPKNPDNVGKVFLYDMPKTLFAKISEALKPEFEGEVPVDVFDMWDGADFQLKAYKKTNTEFLNFDKSAFKSPGPIKIGKKVLTDEELEVIYNSLYSLTAEIASDKFKSYTELLKRFNMVQGIREKVETSKSSPSNPTPPENDDIPFPSDEMLSDDAEKSSDDDSSFFDDM